MPYPVVDRSIALGSTSGAGQGTTATSSALIYLNAFSGAVDVNLNAGAGVTIDANAAPTVDMVAISNSGQGTTTNNVDGLAVNFTTAAVAGARTNAAVQVDVTSGATEASDTLYGINIGNLTGQTGTEYALNVGTGWDRGLSIGDATDYVAFSSSSNSTIYAGAARPTKSLILSVEYDGATLTASSSATTTGSMTGDIERDADLGWMNYYDWTSTEASLQDYTVSVQVTLPQDFSAWATTNAMQVNFATEYTDSAKNKLDVIIYNMSENPDKIVYQTLGNVSSPAADWETITIDDSLLDDGTLPDWDAAGETAIIYLKMYSLVDATNCTGGTDNGCYVRVGNITLNYLARF